MSLHVCTCSHLCEAERGAQLTQHLVLEQGYKETLNWALKWVEGTDC